MTDEELCLQYQTGDANAAEELISRNMKFIRSYARRYGSKVRNGRINADDFLQEGAIALLRAASQFDPARQVQFLSYAGRAVENAMKDALYANNPNILFLSLDDSKRCPINDSDTDFSDGRINSQLPSAYEADPERICIRKEQLEELYAAIHALPPRDRAWVTSRYGFDDDEYKSLSEMGRIYHLSENRARKTEKDAIRNLKTELRAAQ